MGANTSKQNPNQSTAGYTDEQIKEALANQRRLYDKKCEELLRAQKQTEEKLLQVQQNINQQQTSNNVFQQTAIQAQAPLYPNLYNLGNNNFQATAAYANSTSYFQSPSNTGLSSNYARAPVSQPRPTAPPDPAEAMGYAAKPSPKPPHPQSGTLIRQPTQPNLVLSSQAVPSTSSAAQSTKKVLPHTKPQTRKPTRYEASKSIVKCVTCSNELGVHIYQCKNGHSSCKHCRQTNAQCGQCQYLITDMRNIMLETHIAEIKLKELEKGDRMKCPNSEEGCRLSLKKHQQAEHLKECPYRLMACPLAAIFGVCTWKGKINQLVAHFKEEHQEHMEADIDKEMYLLNIDDNHKIVYLVKLGTYNFLIHIAVDANKETICMIVQSMSTKFSASKWSYELHVYNKRQPRRKYQYADTCISNSESVQENFQQKKCAVLDCNYAKTFLDNNRLTYKFYIKNNAFRDKV